MPAIGGSLVEVNLDGRLFAIAADADSNRKLGGSENEFQANGNGTGRLIKTTTGWSLDGIAIEIDDDRGDEEYVQGLQNSNEFFDIYLTYASGKTYQGVGQIVGETPTSSQNATKPIALMGSGVLTVQ